MMKRISTAIVNNISKSGNYNSDQREQMSFALESILNDLSKSLVLLIAFALFGYMEYYLVTLITTVLIRTSIGGFHMTGYWTCFLFSTLYFMFMLLLYLVPVSDLLLVPTLVACMLVQFLIAPVSTKQRESIKKINKTALRNRGLIISAAVLFHHVIINNPNTRISMWVIIIQTLFIIIYKGVKSYEKVSENGM